MITFTNDGLHLKDTILWLDSKKSGSLNFLSSCEVVPGQGQRQIIATEETKKILESKHRKILGLICQYCRPFSLGHLQMELLPSGTVLGGAILYVEQQNKKSLLYAPSVLLEKNSLVHHLKLKKANTLVLEAKRPNPTLEFPSRKKEMERLVEEIKSSVDQGKYPTVLVNPLGVSQEICKKLLDLKIPVAVHSSIYKINKVYEQFGSKIGPYALYSAKRTKNKVVLAPLKKGAVGVYASCTQTPVFWVQDQLDSHLSSGFFKESYKRFVLSSYCEGKDFKSIINQVEPEETYIFGPYAKEYISYLENQRVPNIKYLSANHQRPLF